MATIRRALGLERVHILGNSWGGMLAQEYALTQPEGISSLVLHSSLASSPQWVTEANFALRDASDHVHFWGILLASTLLLSALYRMLLPLSDSEQAYAYYRKTLLLYMTGVGLAISVFALSPVL